MGLAEPMSVIKTLVTSLNNSTVGIVLYGPILQLFTATIVITRDTPTDVV